MVKIFLILTIISSSLFAIEGSYETSCIQTQMNQTQGNIIETYTFSNDSFKMIRRWFRTPSCTGDIFQTNIEEGTYIIGKENLNNGFNPKGTFDLDLSIKDSKSLGLIWISEDKTVLKISRGIGNMRNTMLGLFEYKLKR